MVRALASHQRGLGSILALGLSLLLVLALLRGFFSGVFRFSSLHKNQHSKFQFDQHKADVASSFNTVRLIYKLIMSQGEFWPR